MRTNVTEPQAVAAEGRVSGKQIGSPPYQNNGWVSFAAPETPSTLAHQTLQTYWHP